MCVLCLEHNALRRRFRRLELYRFHVHIGVLSYECYYAKLGPYTNKNLVSATYIYHSHNQNFNEGAMNALNRKQRPF